MSKISKKDFKEMLDSKIRESYKRNESCRKNFMTDGETNIETSQYNNKPFEFEFKKSKDGNYNKITE